MILEIERCDLIEAELKFTTERIGRLRSVIEKGERVVDMYEKNRDRMLDREKTYQSEILILTDDRNKWKRRFEFTAAGLAVILIVGVLF